MLHLDEALGAAAGGTAPGNILFVVITDGLENASREFSRSRVLGMIEKRKADDWQFVFLSADLDAVQEAGDLGVPMMSRMAFAKSSGGVDAMYSMLAEKVSDVRSRRSPRVEFDDADRAKQEEERKKAA
jgi:hypothetical protein